MFVPAAEKGYGLDMLSMREVGIVAQREILRNIRSTKGIAMFALFFLGGLVPAVARLIIGRFAKDVPEEVIKAGFLKYLKGEYGSDAVANYVSNAPRIIYFLFEGTLMFLPFLVLLVGFDQIAGEVQHRTLRYSAGRATRASIVVGKAVGMWAVIAVMVSFLHLTVWILSLVQGDGAGVFSWGGRLLFFALFCASAYVGFSSLVSAFFRTPTVALFAGVGIGAVLWLGYKTLGGIVGLAELAKNDSSVGWRVPEWLAKGAESAQWLFPNRYEKLLLQPDALSVITGIALFLLWGAVCVAGSSAIVARRDI